MPNDSRRVPLRLIFAPPPLITAASLAAPWPLHRLAENRLLPGGVIEPDTALAVRTAGTDVGDWLAWWLGRCSDGAFRYRPLPSHSRRCRFGGPVRTAPRRAANSELPREVAVVASVAAATWAFRDAANFNEGVLRAVNRGDDADTSADSSPGPIGAGAGSV